MCSTPLAAEKENYFYVKIILKPAATTKIHNHLIFQKKIRLFEILVVAAAFNSEQFYL